MCMSFEESSSTWTVVTFGASSSLAFGCEWKGALVCPVAKIISYGQEVFIGQNPVRIDIRRFPLNRSVEGLFPGTIQY